MGEILGQNLKALRQKKGLTAKEVAESLGMKVEELQCYEYGIRTPSKDALDKLSKYYGIDAAELHIADSFSGAKPASKPSIPKPAPQPTPKPVAPQPAQKLTTQPVQKPATQPAAPKPAAQPAKTPAAQPVQKSVQQLETNKQAAPTANKVEVKQEPAQEVKPKTEDKTQTTNNIAAGSQAFAETNPDVAETVVDEPKVDTAQDRKLKKKQAKEERERIFRENEAKYKEEKKSKKDKDVVEGTSDGKELWKRFPLKLHVVILIFSVAILVGLFIPFYNMSIIFMGIRILYIEISSICIVCYIF